MASAFAISSQSSRFIAVGLTGFRSLGQGGCALNGRASRKIPVWESGHSISLRNGKINCPGRSSRFGKIDVVAVNRYRFVSASGAGKTVDPARSRPKNPADWDRDKDAAATA